MRLFFLHESALCSCRDQVVKRTFQTFSLQASVTGTGVRTSGGWPRRLHYQHFFHRHHHHFFHRHHYHRCWRPPLLQGRSDEAMPRVPPAHHGDDRREGTPPPGALRAGQEYHRE